MADLVAGEGTAAHDGLKLALCGLPQMLDDIVTRVAHDAGGLQIVARLELSDDLDEVLSRTAADLLVCAVPEDEIGARWTALLARRAPATVINLGPDAQGGRIYALRATQAELAEVSMRSLLGALREMATTRARPV